MRKHIIYVIAITVITMALSMVSNAQAKDILLDSVAKNVTTKLDKNGSEYVRIIIEQEKSLSGYKYKSSTAVMFFGKDLVEQAKEIQKGQAFKAIVQTREYRGRESYTALALID